MKYFGLNLSWIKWSWNPAQHALKWAIWDQKMDSLLDLLKQWCI